MGIESGIRIDRLVEQMATTRPHQPALIYGEQCWTFAQLLAEMRRRAMILRAAGVQPGDVVGTTAPISGDLLIAFLACCRADLSFLPLSGRLTAAEVGPLLLRADVRLLLTVSGTERSCCGAVCGCAG
jgi:acyl-CoA synthetase (AMP-forming)/AMP-acid ligase II